MTTAAGPSAGAGHRTRRGPVAGPVKRWAGRALRMSAVALAAALVLFAAGAAVGRWHELPAMDSGGDVGIPSSSAVFLVPVPSLKINAGDVICVRVGKHHPPTLFRVRHVVDSFAGKVEVFDARGKPQILEMPSTTWRVSRVTPFVGMPLRLLANPIPAVVLVLVGILLIAQGEHRRRPRRRDRRKRGRPDSMGDLRPESQVLPV